MFFWKDNSGPVKPPLKQFWTWLCSISIKIFVLYVSEKIIGYCNFIVANNMAMVDKGRMDGGQKSE